MTEEELRLDGFRWLAETELLLASGKKIVVKPDGYLRSREVLATTERSKKALRLYTIRIKDEAAIQHLSELEVERLLGDEQCGQQ